jgi:hypothetical protein
VLDEIIDGVRADLAERQARVSLDELKERAAKAPATAASTPAGTASRATVDPAADGVAGRLVADWLSAFTRRILPRNRPHARVRGDPVSDRPSAALRAVSYASQLFALTA